MNIAFIHYHLKTGGVTSVLRQQVTAISKACNVLVLTGGPPESEFPADVIHIPGLGYTIDESESPDPAAVAESIVRAIHEKWAGGCDILHIHNPLLSKNKDFLKIIGALQKQNIKLFLQIHDFAEDGRPLAYFSEPYPADCHYGVINSRDYTILLKSGLKKEGLHKVINTIRAIDVNEPPVQESRVVYPVRGIRRKNIGEAILLALFFKNSEILSITLPPNSPADWKSYDGWKQFVGENNLNVEFEAGVKDDFEALVNASQFLITTSITEGFGFSFLEPWAAGKMLWGRKLPGICDDFEASGIQLDHLYTRLLVPVAWVGEKTLYEKWTAAVFNTCSLLNHPIDRHRIDKAFGEITRDGNIDMGLLDETFQKQAIFHVLSDTKHAEKLKSLNPFLEDFGETPDPDQLIERNKNAALAKYGQDNQREDLLSIYRRIDRTTVRQHIDKQTLLSHFLELENFSLLKWGGHYGITV